MSEHNFHFTFHFSNFQCPLSQDTGGCWPTSECKCVLHLSRAHWCLVLNYSLCESRTIWRDVWISGKEFNLWIQALKQVHLESGWLPINGWLDNPSVTHSKKTLLIKSILGNYLFKEDLKLLLEWIFDEVHENLEKSFAKFIHIKQFKKLTSDRFENVLRRIENIQCVEFGQN